MFASPSTVTLKFCESKHYSTLYLCINNKILVTMKRIWNWIIHIPYDKLLHDGVMIRVTALAILILKLFGLSNIESVCYGWGVGFIVGIGKEIYDEIKKKSSEASDWTVDIIATTEVSLFSYIIMSL